MDSDGVVVPEEGPTDGVVVPEEGPTDDAPTVHDHRRWIWGGATLLLVLIGFAGWVGFRTWQAYTSLSAAKSTIATDLQTSIPDLTEIDPVKLAATIADIQADAHRARNAVEDPLFRLAAGLPIVGRDLTAVTSIATTVDDLAQQVLPSLISLTDAVSPGNIAPHDNSIDLTPLIAAASTLRTADTAVATSVAEVATIDRSGLTGAVRNSVDELAERLGSLKVLTATGARLTEILPLMLGTDGARRYLIVFQNLAELRSTGGMFGSYAVLTADNGHLLVSGQGATQRTIARFSDPVAPLTPDQLNVYNNNIATIPMDVNFTPDFPTAAQLFATMYQQRIDPAPLDGVIAIDPVALAAVLKGFEPVTVDQTELNSTTLVKFLLSDVYSTYQHDPDETRRDAYLARATSAAFNALTTTPRDVRTVVKALKTSADQRRLLFYSVHPDEQATLRSIDYTGELPARDRPDSPTFGIFMTDRTFLGSKLAYYLSGKTDLTLGSCRTDGSREVTAVVHLRSDAPSSGLPEEVSGAGPLAYVLVDEFRVFAPTGASITGAEFNGTAVEVSAGTDLGRPVGRFTVNLLPGSSSTVTVHFLLPPPGSADGITPDVRQQPFVHPWPITAPAAAGCG